MVTLSFSDVDIYIQLPRTRETSVYSPRLPISLSHINKNYQLSLPFHEFLSEPHAPPALRASVLDSPDQVKFSNEEINHFNKNQPLTIGLTYLLA